MDSLSTRDRRQQLLDIVDSLTLDEVRQLKARLAQVNFQYDIFPQLPVELQLLVVDYFAGRDLWIYLTVSTKWRAALLQGNVLKSLSRTWFPGLIEHATEESLPHLFVQASKNCYVRSRGRFRSVLYHGMWLEDESYFSLDPTLHPPGVSGQAPAAALNPYAQILANPLDDIQRLGLLVVEKVLYSHGRIAWQANGSAPPDNSLLIVDDFRTRIRKVFNWPGTAMTGRTLDLVALGDNLVVAMTGRRMVAWHLESNQMDTVQLVYPARKVTTHGNTVAMIVLESEKSSNQLYLWKFGLDVQEIDPLLPGTNGRNMLLPANGHPFDRFANDRFRTGYHIPDLIIHPTEHDVFFLVSPVSRVLNEHDNSVFVQEFRAGRYYQTLTFKLAINKRPGDLIWLKCQRSSSYGIYTVLSIWSINDPSTTLFTCPNLKLSRSPSVTVLKFNVHTRTFAVLCHHPPVTGAPNSDVWLERHKFAAHFWNTQCLVWIRDRIRSDPASNITTNLPALALEDCLLRGRTAALSDVPLYTSLRAQATSSQDTQVPANVTRRRFMKFTEVVRPMTQLSNRYIEDSRGIEQEAAYLDYMKWLCESLMPQVGLSFALDADESSTTETAPLYMSGDDEFLVFIHHGGYTVWSFCHDFPASDSLGDKHSRSGRRSQLDRQLVNMTAWEPVRLSL